MSRFLLVWYSVMVVLVVVVFALGYYLPGVALSLGTVYALQRSFRRIRHAR
jgi:hypothetical protein